MSAFNSQMDEVLLKSNPQLFVLTHLAHLLKTQCEIQGERLFFPKWNLTVYPEVAQIKERLATLHFTASCPSWDRAIVDSSAGLGVDIKQALGMAESGFVFGLLNGLEALFEGKAADTLDSQLGSQNHHWQVYRSNIVGIGDGPKHVESEVYWNTLKEGVAKRIGGQKICYVKVFGSKNGDDVTGECRINDIPSPELGEMVAGLVRQWETQSFATHKQFFLLKQEEETYQPYPVAPRQIEAGVLETLRLFGACDTPEQYQHLVADIEETVGDTHLAEELYCFLPELCAEMAFDRLDTGETITINVRDAQITVYKTQLASYYAILRALDSAIAKGVVGNDVFSRLVSVSSTYNVVQKAKGEGDPIDENGGRLLVAYGFSDRYALR